MLCGYDNRRQDQQRSRGAIEQKDLIQQRNAQKAQEESMEPGDHDAELSEGRIVVLLCEPGKMCQSRKISGDLFPRNVAVSLDHSCSNKRQAQGKKSS
jgi:hypothetical protein